MRLLMLYTDMFSYEPASVNSEMADETAEPATIQKTLVGFIHVEAADEENLAAVETKLVKNLKWAARKNETQAIVLHSFAHLAPSKAEPTVTAALLNRAEDRLRASGYQTHQTPFGYFLHLNIQAPGHSFSRLFKEF